MSKDHALTTASPAAMLAEARARLGDDPARTATVARRLLAANPRAVQPALLLGAALRRLGDPAALGVLEPLAAALPDVWGAQYEHGMALAALGRSEPAAAALARAVAANPQSSLAAHALGDQLMLLGQPREAAELHARPLAGSVHDAQLGRGATALFDGDRPGAAAILIRQLGFDLNDIGALRLIADAGLHLGRFEDAAALLARVTALAPAFAPAHYARAVALYRLEHCDTARDEIEAALALRPGTTVLLALRAAIRGELGDAEGATTDYDAVLAADPGDAQAWHAQGHALRAAGRQAEAIAAYRRAVDLRPGFGEAWWSLANLKVRAFEPGDAARMTAARDDAEADDRAYLDFALGKAREDEGRYAEAFDHYSRGNAARRAATPHDAAAATAFVARCAATFTAEFFATRAGAGSPAPDPIFIVGMPRSGSTLVEQILASHSQVEGLSELPDLPAVARDTGAPYPEVLTGLEPVSLRKLGEAYLARTQVRRRLSCPRFVDKFPGNYHHIGLIQLILPNARIIDVRREPMACCVSLWKQAFARGQAYSYDLGDLGRAYADYAALTAHFDRVLPGRVHRLSYEALVDDPEAQIRRLLDHVRLDFEPGCLRFFETARVVRTPSSEQVRRPINRHGLDGWRHFEPWLDDLRTALAKR